MILEHNRQAWDMQVEQGNPWTIAVTAAQIAEARAGKLQILLTPTIFVPQAWFPPLAGARVLCLASGGGQQGPLLAAAGAEVTVLDNSPRQLARDRQVAEREGLSLTTVQGDMARLDMFEPDSFDLIVHPVSNCFVPDVRPVWREAWRVLKPDGVLLAGFNNPVVYLFDEQAYDRGGLVVKHKLPYADTDILSDADVSDRLAQGRPLEFGHTLADQIGGQMAAGFSLTGFFEDRYNGDDALSQYMAWFIATRATKR